MLGILGDQLAALTHLCHHWVRGGVNLQAIGDFSVMRGGGRVTCKARRGVDVYALAVRPCFRLNERCGPVRLE